MARRMTGTSNARMTSSIAIIATMLLSLLHQGHGQDQDVVITELQVPAHVQRFTNVTLTCNYASEHQPVFIQWFHNGLQFTQFEFGDSERNKEDVFTVFDEDSMIEVIREQSTGKKLVLKEVNLTASGNYTCEVTGEKPNFTKVNKTKTMTVVVIPEEQPIIEGAVPARAHYAVGDTVNLTCIAPPSVPVATLTWYINDEKAPDEYLYKYPTEKNKAGHSIARLRLNFELSHSHFINQELKLKCVAAIPTLYLESNEHSQQEPVKNKGVRTLPEDLSLVTTGTSASAQVLGSPSNAVLLPVIFLLCLPFLL